MSFFTVYLCFELFNKYIISYRIKKTALEFIERHKFDNTMKCRCRNTHKPKLVKMSNLKLFFIEYLKIIVIKLYINISYLIKKLAPPVHIGTLVHMGPLDTASQNVLQLAKTSSMLIYHPVPFHQPLQNLENF